MRKALIVFGILVRILGSSHADAADLEKVRSLVEGSYELIEWIDEDGTHLFPPAVSARFILRDGVATYVANKSKGDFLVSYSGIGAYKVTATTFAFGFSKHMSVTKAAGTENAKLGFALATDLLLPSMRAYDLVEADRSLKGSNGERSVTFSIEGFSYADPISKNTRIYKRIMPPGT